MGNRAHVIFVDNSGAISPAVYLHWNGGPESVYAFLRILGERGGFGVDVSYMAARFAGIVAEFFGPEDCQSLGVVNGPKSITANWMSGFTMTDNGAYVVTSDGISQWSVDRWLGGRDTYTPAKKCNREFVDKEYRSAVDDKKYAAIVRRLTKKADAPAQVA